MYGIDISNYQSSIDLSKGNYDFAIIKATEGIGFVDKSFSKFAIQLTKLNKLIGCYHFARPDLNGTINGMENEAKHFVSTVENQGLKKKAILVLDWETEPMDRPDLIEAWVNKVIELTEAIPFIYGSKSKLTKWQSYEIVKSLPKWMAVWPSLKRFEAGINPILSLPETTFDWAVWQYSNVGSFPGFKGNVDLDNAIITKETWMQYAGQKEDDKEIISKEMEWAISIGLFHGYGDGKFRPKEPLTREQAAALFYRYNKYISDLPI